MIRPPTGLLRIIFPTLLVFLFFIYLGQRESSTPIRENQQKPQLEIAIPKTVHQLLLDMPGHPVSQFKPNSHSISWQQSGWKVEYWSEEACGILAAELDIFGFYSQTFQALPSAVLRSDFCRYLIMFGRGGIYNDLDVHLKKPLPWDVMGPTITERPSIIDMDWESPPSLIVGLEGDAFTSGLARSPQFVQWTIAASPKHPILRQVLDKIAEFTPGFNEQEAQKKIEVNVMDWTGPGVWTDAILQYLNCTEEELAIVRDLKDPIRIKDVLVLPKRSFAIIQGDDHSSPDILVKHYFSGTWKHRGQGWFGS
ncbi:MAG: hypothetical protein MMC33_008234 [Icmadophila ericetorum]|nr:hypothetical protein [Icmadophila ericetorum]